LLTVEQVVARYFFSSSSIALQELEWHAFGAIFLLSMAWTYQKDGHVRVDVFYQHFPRRVKALVNLLGICFFTIPICYFMVLYGLDDVWMAYNYINPRVDDYWSLAWFGRDSSFYDTAATFESWLRTFLLVGEVSPDPGGLEARWLARALIPLGFTFLGLQAVSLALGALVEIFNVREPRGEA
jgi:TRAP-type mannitol/chloroaromatic compound transport system permease small subunit